MLKAMIFAGVVGALPGSTSVVVPLGEHAVLAGFKLECPNRNSETAPMVTGLNGSIALCDGAVMLTPLNPKKMTYVISNDFFQPEFVPPWYRRYWRATINFLYAAKRTAEFQVRALLSQQ